MLIVYASLTREPELQDWVTKTKPEERKAYPLTDEIREAIDRFFFNHYCQQFRSGAFARANCSMCVLKLSLIIARISDSTLALC